MFLRWLEGTGARNNKTSNINDGALLLRAVREYSTPEVGPEALLAPVSLAPPDVPEHTNPRYR